MRPAYPASWSGSTRTAASNGGQQVSPNRSMSSTGFDGGFELPLSRLLGEGGAAVLGLVLHRWDEADLAVEPAEVEPVDVLSDGDLEVVDALPGPAVADQLGLEQGASGFSVGSVGPDLIWSEAERLRRTALVDPRQAAYTRSPRGQGHPMIVRPGVAQTLAGQANHHRDPPLTARGPGVGSLARVN